MRSFLALAAGVLLLAGTLVLEAVTDDTGLAFAIFVAGVLVLVVVDVAAGRRGRHR